MRMRMTVLGLVLASAVLAGCASAPDQSTSLQLALAERDQALSRLMKAIASYCSARHGALEARQRCVLEKRLDVLGPEDIMVLAPATIPARAPLRLSDARLPDRPVQNW